MNDKVQAVRQLLNVSEFNSHAGEHSLSYSNPLMGRIADALMSGPRDYYLVTNEKGLVTYISQALSQLWPTETASLNGTDIEDSPLVNILPPVFFSSVKKALCGTEVQCEFWHPAVGADNGRNRYFEVTCTPLCDNAAITDALIIRMDDRTEFELLRSELDETKKRLSDFAAATSDWQWEMDSELRFTWVSREIAHFIGISRENLYGRPRMPLLDSPEEEQAWREHIALLERREPFRDYIYRLNTDNGVCSVSVSGVPLFTGNGEFIGYRGTSTDITEVERVKAQAKQLESRFISAIDEFPGSLALYDTGAKLIVFNRSYANSHEFLGEQLKPGLSYRECLQAKLEAKQFVMHDGEPITDSESWIDVQLQRLQRASDSVELRCSDGRWLNLALQQLPEGGFLETLVDISAHKASELAVNEERNLLRSLIDNIPDYIFAKDCAGGFIVKNRSATSYMNAVRESSIGLSDDPGEHATDFDYYRPEVAEAYRREDLEVMEQGRSILNQEKRISPVGAKEPIWISTSKVPLRDIEGNVVGLVGTSRNISKRKLAERKMLESNERFRDFAETAAELFWETDAESNITYISERYLELTGYRPELVMGKSVKRVILSCISDPDAVERVNSLISDNRAISELEIRVYQKSGGIRYMLLSGNPRFDRTGRFLGYRGVGRDITKPRELEEKLQHQASHDELTQLPNRREFMRRLEAQISLVKAGEQTAVLGYVDLDQFKIVNDSVGHIAGDALLVQVASLIESQLRQSDTVARLGGDEFGVLIHDVSTEDAVKCFQGIISQVDAFRFKWNNQVFGIGASVGLVGIGDIDVDASELMSCADVACFAAKDGGRGRVHVYRPQVSNRSLQHRQLLMAAGIRHSIAENRFQLYAQPIASFSDSDEKALEVHHYEILTRLLDENGELVFPGTFIPAAERYELMGEIDRWVVTNTLEKIQSCSDSGCSFTVTINLSGQSLTDKSLAGFVKSQLQRYEIDPAGVCFEITETAAIRNLSLACAFITEMKDIGCTFALDDFGSGLSSFGYLKHFDVDYLKIDGSFIRDIATDETDRVMVNSINQMGKSLGVATIAEFVESEGAIKILREIGVDMLQGYAIGKPVPFDSVFSPDS